MVDIHAHVIFGVDDGPSTIEESIEMIQAAQKAGVKVVIATPHLMKELFDTKGMVENYNTLLDKITDFNVELLLGYEVFINPFIPDMLDNNSLTLNDSRYLLIELPFDSIPLFSFDVIYKLQLREVIPILAHPERNRNFLKDFHVFSKFYDRGCLVQLDAKSIMGVHGHQVKQFAKHIIKKKMAHFVASDAHSPKDYDRWYQDAYIKVKKWAGIEYADKLFGKNALKMLKNSKEIIL